MLGVSYGVDFCPSFNSINIAPASLHALYMTLSHAWSWLKDSTAGRWNSVQTFLLFVESSRVLWCCFKGWKSSSSFKLFQHIFAELLLFWPSAAHVELYVRLEQTVLRCFPTVSIQGDDVTFPAYTITQWCSSRFTPWNDLHHTEDFFFPRKTQFHWK